MLSICIRKKTNESVPRKKKKINLEDKYISEKQITISMKDKKQK